jgi:hypothetical protein
MVSDTIDGGAEGVGHPADHRGHPGLDRMHVQVQLADREREARQEQIGE